MKQLGTVIVVTGALALGALSFSASEASAQEARAILNADLQHCEFAAQSPFDHNECFKRAMRDYLHTQAKYHAAKTSIERTGGEDSMPDNRKALNTTLEECNFKAESPFDHTECYNRAKAAYLK